MMKANGDGTNWKTESSSFNGSGPITVPPWDKPFPKNNYKTYFWQDVIDMDEEELLYHFTVRYFESAQYPARYLEKEIVYRCNLIAACRQEYAGDYGESEMKKHLMKHMRKLKRSQGKGTEDNNLVFYAAGDKFPLCVLKGQQMSSSLQIKESPCCSQELMQCSDTWNKHSTTADSDSTTVNDDRQNCSSVHLQGLDKLVSSAFGEHLDFFKNHNGTPSEADNTEDDFEFSNSCGSSDLGSENLIAGSTTKCDGSHHSLETMRTETQRNASDHLTVHSFNGITERDINTQASAQSVAVVPNPDARDNQSVDSSKSSIDLLNDCYKRLVEETVSIDDNPHFAMTPTSDHSRTTTFLRPSNTSLDTQLTSSTQQTVTLTEQFNQAANFAPDNASLHVFTTKPLGILPNMVGSPEACTEYPDSSTRDQLDHATNFAPDCSSLQVFEAKSSSVSSKNFYRPEVCTEYPDNSIRDSNVCMDSPYQQDSTLSSPCAESVGAISCMQQMIEQFPPISPYSKQYRPLRPHPVGYFLQTDSDSSEYTADETSQSAVGNSTGSSPQSTTVGSSQNSPGKYSELLAVIEELGKDIRPTYAGSKNAAERLKKGIMHARVLVRECLVETDRCARQ